MKTSKVRYAALILLVANIASAFWMVVIMIFIGTCVAGTIFHGLYTIAAHIDPVNPPPNMPAANSEYIDIIPFIPPIVGGPWKVAPTNATIIKGVSDMPVPATGVTFGMTYGVVSEQGAWIRSGCNLDEITNSIVVTVTDTPDAYSFAWSVNGQWFLYSITSNAGDAGIVTRLDGPPSTDTNLYYSVMIERTTDFVQWTPIYTNLYCPDNCPQFFTDTNAPVDSGFYRAMTQ
jgi:hypothetical protein